MKSTLPNAAAIDAERALPGSVLLDPMLPGEVSQRKSPTTSQSKINQ